jgi:hypothetical protein
LVLLHFLTLLPEQEDKDPLSVVQDLRLDLLLSTLLKE